MVTQMDDNDNADNEYNGNNDKDTNDHSQLNFPPPKIKK